MERGNSKHGPRLDERMATEVSGIVRGGGARVEEWHDPEPSGDDQPPAANVVIGHRAGAPPGMTYEEVEERSRLGKFIPISRLPGDRDALIAGATALRAPDDILRVLSQLPENETYETVNQIWAALGHHNEARRT